MTHYSTFFQTLVEIIITVVEKDPPWIMKRLNAKENLRKDISTILKISKKNN